MGLFHYIQTLVDNYSEMIVVDKKKAPLWSRRLHMALRAYQELLMTLGAMDKVSTESVRNSSRVLKGNIFYVLEYREMCLVLLQAYKESQHSLAYLKDLVETAHIFLKLFQEYCQANRHVIVQKKNRVKSKSSKNKKKKKTNEPGTATAESPTVSFDEISGEISAVLQEETSLPDGEAPFDAASDLSMEDQRYKYLLVSFLLFDDSSFFRSLSLIIHTQIRSTGQDSETDERNQDSAGHSSSEGFARSLAGRGRVWCSRNPSRGRAARAPRIVLLGPAR